MLRDILITYAAFHPGNHKPELLTNISKHHYGLCFDCLFACAPRVLIVDSEVSYAQGMNDLCSRFLEVLDSEVDTFWSFSCYMEKFSKDFMPDGLHRKIGEITKKTFPVVIANPKFIKQLKHLEELSVMSSELEAALLKELDPQLYAHLATDSMESFTFCHR